MCEPCGDGCDGCASPKQPVFRVPCGQPLLVFDSRLVLVMPRDLGPPAVVLQLWGWRPGSYMGGETSPERGLGVPLEGTVDVWGV